MGGHLEGFSDGGVSRLEVMEGPTGRQRRTKAERARIAAESLVPGTSVTEVARRHGTTRWQVYDWRRRLRLGDLALPESAEPLFAPLLVDDALSPRLPPKPPKSAAAEVEIVVGDAVIRTTVEVEQLAQVIRAVRASL